MRSDLSTTADPRDAASALETLRPDQLAAKMSPPSTTASAVPTVAQKASSRLRTLAVQRGVPSLASAICGFVDDDRVTDAMNAFRDLSVSAILDADLSTAGEPSRATGNAYAKALEYNINREGRNRRARGQGSRDTNSASLDSTAADTHTHTADAIGLGKTSERLPPRGRVRKPKCGRAGTQHRKPEGKLPGKGVVKPAEPRYTTRAAAARKTVKSFASLADKLGRLWLDDAAAQTDGDNGQVEQAPMGRFQKHRKNSQVAARRGVSLEELCKTWEGGKQQRKQATLGVHYQNLAVLADGPEGTRPRTRIQHTVISQRREHGRDRQPGSGADARHTSADRWHQVDSIEKRAADKRVKVRERRNRMKASRRQRDEDPNIEDTDAEAPQIAPQQMPRERPTISRDEGTTILDKRTAKLRGDIEKLLRELHSIDHTTTSEGPQDLVTVQGQQRAKWECIRTLGHLRRELEVESQRETEFDSRHEEVLRAPGPASPALSGVANLGTTHIESDIESK